MKFLEALPTAYQILFWILVVIIGLLFAMSIYFLKRFIGTQDQTNKAVRDQLGKHADDMEDYSGSIKDITSEMKSEVVKIKELHLDHQREVQTQVLAVKESILEVENCVHRVQNEVRRFDESIKTTKNRLEVMFSTVENHTRSLERGASRMKRLEDRLNEQDTNLGKVHKDFGKLNENFKTVIEKISDKMVIVKGKPDPEGSGA